VAACRAFVWLPPTGAPRSGLLVAVCGPLSWTTRDLSSLELAVIGAVDTTSTLQDLLTFAGPLVGVAIGAWGSARAAKVADRRSQRTELTRALANYMAAARGNCRRARVLPRRQSR
jgi:hypothetical protein